MNNIVKKTITWHYANQDETDDTFNPKITAFVNHKNLIYIEISNVDNETTQFIVLDLPTAKDFASHILNEIHKVEKSCQDG